MTLAALATTTTAHAQAAAPDDEAFAAHRWHFEADAQAALEAWNYNISHEEIYAIAEGLTYGMRDGLVLRMNQRIAYVSQRSQDAVLLGLTMGVRGRVYRRGRVSAFLQGELGVSYTAIATPPRGTRFNYLAAGGGGAMARVHPRVHLVTTLQLIHISNAGLKGAGRNPDLEAIGLSVGLLFRF
jgi:Lipid A 3-O-deacylase (PagL)